MNALARISAQNKLALREGLKIVRKVVASDPYPAGFTTAELFKLVVKEPVPLEYTYEKPSPRRSPLGKSAKPSLSDPQPSHPHHPIRSITFLKHSVLPILAGRRELEMIRTTRIPVNQNQRVNGKRKTKQESSAAAPAPVTVWLWKKLDETIQARPRTLQLPKKRFGTEVGVSEDWSHLNRRRERARDGKVRRDVAIMKTLIRAKETRKKLARKTSLKARLAAPKSKATSTIAKASTALS